MQVFGSQKFLELCSTVPEIWMGIVNLTPDSFSDGGKFNTMDAAVARSLALVQAGAHILDFGGVSTRPRHVYNDVAAVSPVEELGRVREIIRTVKAHIPAHMLISIDTFSPYVAAQLAQENLIDIINDVLAGVHRDADCDYNTMQVAAKYQLGYILMHAANFLNPDVVQSIASVTEVYDFLKIRLAMARDYGVTALAIDPGIGFGKTFEQNLALLSEEFLAKLHTLHPNVLIGISRKNFLVQLHPELKEFSSRDKLTKQLEYNSLHLGANIVRSHQMPKEVFHARDKAYRAEPKTWQIQDLQAATVLSMLQKKSETAERKPLCIFDLDGTLFDVSYRTLGIVHEWLNSDQSSGLSKKVLRKIAKLNYLHLGYSLEHTFENAGLDLKNSEVLNVYFSLKKMWQKKFFASDSLVKYDQVLTNAVAFVHAIVDSNIQVLYLSGRFHGDMYSGTYEQLAKHGFPSSQIILKPDFNLADQTFKAAVIKDVSKQFEVVGNFENEYLNIAHMAPEAQGALHVIVDSLHSGKPVPDMVDAPIIYRLTHF